MRHTHFIWILLALSAGNIGCAGRIFGEITSWQPSGDPWRGITYYVGGAGPIGNIGSFDVPGGMRDAGYSGDVRVFAWQSWLHAGDQLNIRRNREKGHELAEMIRQNRRQYPRAPINIIALSAGTGIATFALENLAVSAPVNNVVFFGCSMSSRYDLTQALRRVQGRLYVLHSTSDGILKNLVWYTGTVDRASGEEGIAGLVGFELPYGSSDETRRQYAKVVNVRYRSEFMLSDNKGGHTDATARLFVRRYIAPAIMGNADRLVGAYPDRRFINSAATDDPQPMPSASQHKPQARDRRTVDDDVRDYYID